MAQPHTVVIIVASTLMHKTRRVFVGLVLCAAMLVLGGKRASAQSETGPDFDFSQSYLVDGGAIPFFWLPLTGSATMDRWLPAREQPLGFSEKEGGLRSRRGAELPGWGVSAFAAAAAATMFVDGDQSRWYHLKGFGEAIATTSFLTGTTKRLFGRHRPDWDGSGADSNDGSKSFPSGHASQTAAAVTYFALYLHEHAFDRWREPGTMPWWEIAAYAGLGAIAVGVDAERVYHRRHHATDVIAGSVLGAASSLAFFVYQEYRYDKARARESTEPAAIVSPDAPTLPEMDAPQVSMTFSF